MPLCLVILSLYSKLVYPLHNKAAVWAPEEVPPKFFISFTMLSSSNLLIAPEYTTALTPPPSKIKVLKDLPSHSEKEKSKSPQRTWRSKSRKVPLLNQRALKEKKRKIYQIKKRFHVPKTWKNYDFLKNLEKNDGNKK